MQEDILQPSIESITRGGFVETVIVFLQGLPARLDTMGESGSYMSFISFLWAFFVILVGFVIYISVRTKDLEEREKIGFYQDYGKEALSGSKVKKRTKVWEGIVSNLQSNNVSDWKVAILEADSLLAEIMENEGFPGANLGERLKSIPVGRISSLEDAWEVHKLRNRIAHEKSDFAISKTDFADALAKFERVFREFDYI